MSAKLAQNEEYTSKDLWAENIDRARTEGNHTLADNIQFDESGRCRICEKLMGGDRAHHCWRDSFLKDSEDRNWVIRACNKCNKEHIVGKYNYKVNCKLCKGIVCKDVIAYPENIKTLPVTPPSKIPLPKWSDHIPICSAKCTSFKSLPNNKCLIQDAFVLPQVNVCTPAVRDMKFRLEKCKKLLRNYNE